MYGYNIDNCKSPEMLAFFSKKPLFSPNCSLANSCPAGIEGGQFTLLATVRRVPGISQAHIARRLGMDTTSLTRTLDVLLKHGWIEKAQGSDRRSRVFTITRTGEAQFLQARRYWQRAQGRFASIVGADGVNALVAAVEAAAIALSTEVADLLRARRSARTRKRKARAR